MWVVLAIAVATLPLGLAFQPTHGQMQASNASALETIHMVDAQTGWAVTDRRYAGVCGKEGCLLRTIDGGSQWTGVTPLGSSGGSIRVWKIPHEERRESSQEPARRGPRTYTEEGGSCAAERFADVLTNERDEAPTDGAENLWHANHLGPILAGVLHKINANVQILRPGPED